MTGRELSEDEIREALIERGYEKVAAAFDESTTQRTKLRERLHAELLAEGYKEAAAALSGDPSEGAMSQAREKTDTNALIRGATNSREGPPGADMNAILRSAAGRTPASDKESEENEGLVRSGGRPPGKDATNLGKGPL